MGKQCSVDQDQTSSDLGPHYIVCHSSSYCSDTTASTLNLVKFQKYGKELKCLNLHGVNATLTESKIPVCECAV